MTTYTPDTVPPSAEELPEYIERELLRISDALRHRLDLDNTRQSDVPRPREGMLRWFEGAVYDPGDGSGLYVYENGAWRKYIQEAPSDGNLYARKDGEWVQAPKVPSFAYLADGGISGAWDTTLKTITGYSVSNSTLDMAGFLNPLAGYIEIPTTGVWEVQATVVGDQGNSTKEEAMRLWGRFTDHPTDPDLEVVLDVFDVATDKTSDRAFAFSFKRVFQAGERIYLAVNATASMGTFSFEVTSLEVTSVLT